MHANTGENDDNRNNETIDILTKMQKYYEDTEDNWRAIGYRKAITSLKKGKTFIATAEQASKLPGVGTRIAEKIEEIVATGRLQRLESTDNPDDNAKRLLTGIYGVGPVQAQKWVQAGIKTLQDVLDRGKPTYDQKVGIKHYDELNEKMPRWEAAAISRLVIDEARAIDPGLELHTMGSFRRGAEKCGDVDIIITKPNVQITELRGVLTKLTKRLRIRKVITHDLAVAHNTDGSKWMGIAKRTDPDAKHRRLDILLVPWQELGAALLYFTGNDIFNRSMRLLAKKRGMRLNQHGLFRDGELVVSETEEQIFDALGVPFRPSHERIP
ncbi:Nucleotidyltransferase [Saitoella complicata NRRL Y-17804]|nr:Nucleotidyltransferase [Saitoella complicata NRRL Y-17804]ODQ56013.1 Nucleotidyltransferase [Saitoella complicata NRRL Y-17804]